MPNTIVNVVIGFDGNYNFVNVYDFDNPGLLLLDLHERCELVFKLSDTLIASGWKFEDRPIDIANDFGINFSSYVWVTDYYGETLPPRTCFKMIYECARIGTYDYSLFMRDGHDQRIDLDPKIENGAGRVP